jgi:sugar lactone lactonase YvrE
VYNEDDVQELWFMDIKEKAVRKVNEPKSEKEPYLLAALVLFLAEGERLI